MQPTDRGTLGVILWLSLLPYTYAAGDDATGGPNCSIFEGLNANFLTWLISFSAWIAWKRPTLSGLISGKTTRPTAVDADRPTVAERRAIRKYDSLNIQLYGAVISHVSIPIQTSLHVESDGDGVKSLAQLKLRYGAQSSGDRAEAIARLQRSYIDSRAKISETDVTKQYTEMAIAAADILKTGGVKPDDSTLISMFENSLPSAYAYIRQMVRYSKHQDFSQYYNDFLEQVKAEERTSQSTISAGAFGAYGSRPPMKGKGKGGKGKGGRGSPYTYTGRGGKGGYGGDTSTVTNPCFNCGKSGHPRNSCTQPYTECSY